VLDTYGISGMAGLGNGIRVELDKEAVAEMARAQAGIKTSVDQKGVDTSGKAIEVGSVSNEALADVLRGEGVGLDVVPNTENTKVRERILKPLDPMTSKNVTGTLTKVGEALDTAIESNVQEAGRYFKGGDVAGNMKRLAVLAMNTINGATESDTTARKNTAADGSMLMADQYYASMSNVMEQIGKDYASSYGLKLSGADAAKLAKVHRDLGRFAIKMLQDAGLVEVTDDYMWNRAGSVVNAEGKKLAGANVKTGVLTAKGTDTLTGDEVLLTQDRGIRLADTGAMVDPNDTTGSELKYTSDIGNAMKRVAKLLLPNAEKVPTTEYIDRPIKVDSGITIDKETEAGIKNISKNPLKMKTGVVRDVLSYLRDVNKNESNGLNAGRSKIAGLDTFLGLKNSGSQLLDISDSGSTMGKLDNLIGILDNLDTLSNEDGVFYEYQVDVNNRIT
jgi:hypothetical protein